MPTPPSRRTTLLILVAIAALGLLPSVIYVPSIPDMARDLAVPVGQIQLTLTVYLFAFGISQVVLGPLSDRYGRRSILLSGTFMCLTGSLVCAVAPGINLLLAGRTLQAIGACAGMALSRAMVRDLFDRDGTARAMAIIAMVITVVPVASPVLGGYVHVWLGWRANFVIVATASLVLLLFIFWRMPETNTNLQNQSGLLTGMTSGIAALFRSRRFIGYALATLGGAAAAFGYVAAAPIILIDRMGMTPDQYGFFAALPPLGFLCGSFVTNRIVARTGVDRLILYGGAILAVAGLAMVTIAGHAQPWMLAPSFFLLGLNNGFVMPSASAGLVSVHPHLAGAASGLAGAIQMILSTALPIGILFLGCCIVIVLGGLLSGRSESPAQS
jgi:DHA1 family bicyclomycin/chloramphenicol resistance-like MFS transporter